MGSHLLRDVPDFVAFLGIGSLAVAVYSLVSIRGAIPSRDGLESVAWGKLFIALVYGCMSVLFFWMSSRGI